MRVVIILFSALFVCAELGHGLESRVVDTEEGPVKGYKDPEGGLYAFYSIPYAKAPTGRQRFKAPLPATRRNGVFEAIDKGIICPQKLSFISVLKSANFLPTEDCLIANVFVPETDKKNIPVIVSVHGGGYILGYGNFATYKQLVKSKEVIVVTFNYRLGPHGFLCLGTEDVPGNAGMKDQVTLLRWVQRNIKNFGGNPDDVTLAGQSAGSSSADLLMLSKTTKGLFNKVIPESGSATAAWSVQTDPVAVAKRYARSLNFTGVDFYSLENFFKTISYEILFEGLIMDSTDSTFFFSPCVERDTQEEEFLTESPVNILKSGDYVKLPTLYGFANMEGLLRLQEFEQWKDRMNNNFADFLPPDLQFENEEERNAVANKIRKFYFGDDLMVNDNKILSYIDYFTDIIFAYSSLRSVNLRTSNGDVNNVYLYEFSFVADGTPPIPHTDKRGATHCAQTFIIADGHFPNFNESSVPEDIKEMKHFLRELWSNFVKTGKPIPDGSHLPAWPPASKGWSPHMTIDKTLTLGDALLKERVQFWDEIYDKHYRHPSPPPTPPTKRDEL